MLEVHNFLDKTHHLWTFCIQISNLKNLILRSESNQEHFVIASLIDHKSKEVQSRTQKGAVIFNHLISFLIR